MVAFFFKSKYIMLEKCYGQPSYFVEFWNNFFKRSTLFTVTLISSILQVSPINSLTILHLFILVASRGSSHMSIRLDTSLEKMQKWDAR